jgi:hypothetical protein
VCFDKVVAIQAMLGGGLLLLGGLALIAAAVLQRSGAGKAAGQVASVLPVGRAVKAVGTARAASSARGAKQAAAGAREGERRALASTRQQTADTRRQAAQDAATRARMAGTRRRLEAQRAQRARDERAGIVAPRGGSLDSDSASLRRAQVRAAAARRAKPAPVPEYARAGAARAGTPY